MRPHTHKYLTWIYIHIYTLMIHSCKLTDSDREGERITKSLRRHAASRVCSHLHYGSDFTGQTDSTYEKKNYGVSQ
jgi:hypothetical protein